MVGLLINTFNRPDYLHRCMDSIRSANLNGVQVLIVDDCSTDRRVYELIHGFLIYRMPKNGSIRYSLEKGMELLFDRFGCDIVINLDSDAIVHREFIPTLLKLHKQFPDDIITGFNTLIAGRHPIIEQHDGYCIKGSCGGINMLITRRIYDEKLKRALITAQRTNGHWDDILCNIHREKGGKVICSTPSVVQHIGIKSSMGHNANPDYSHDFLQDKTNKLLVIQPHGLGDVIFTKTLISMLGNYEVTWPVLDQFVDDCKRAYPDINFIPVKISPVDLSIKRDIEVNGYRVIPIRYSNELMRVPYNRVMRAKYDMYRIDFNRWRELAMWKRDHEKENELFKLLNLPDNYTIVNSYFGSDSQYKIDIKVDGVQVRSISGYSLFDWAKVFENATEIHTVSTSILYILDMLNTCPVNVYIRKPTEWNHNNYRYLFTSPKFIYK